MKNVNVPCSRLLIAMAMFCAPLAVHAQTDPDPANPTMHQTPQQTQQQQQQQPGVHRSGSDTMKDSNATPGMTGQEMKDKMFLRKSAEGGIAEVKLGQLASEKALSPEVKSFGAKMVADHTLLNNEMKPIADSMGVRLPRDMNKMDQAEYDKLSGLSATEFDQEYILYMVKDHRKDLREFHMESMSTNDPTLKAAVDKGEGVIREHTKMVTKMAHEKGIEVPPSGRPEGPAVPPPAQ